MLARLASELPRGGDWAHEFKWDGVRAIVFARPGRFRVVSRHQQDLTHRYPELGPLGEALGAHAVVLDGEIVALDQDGVPRFQRLQQRIGLTAEDDVRRRMRETPVCYLAFDLLHLDGRPLMGLPYLERRRLLLDLDLRGPAWRTPEHRRGEAEGRAMLEGARRMGLEGVVAKRTDSVYERGLRTGAWLKVKGRLGQELVIGGWAEGRGRRRGRPGALLVGYRKGGRLVYAGQVGTGFTEADLARLARLMAPLARDRSPFDAGRPPPGAHFVEPRLVGEFAFAEWTRQGQIRAGAFKGLRTDKDARQVVWERPT
ncbi:MAG TPA: non-homologous end-joining DNA ligase [Candidatus Dormibacteraeota bacterium]|nr:non-homologous end-joining DNA ligase [Candidatus Dormibacteraeota bacterium]